jgi:DNA (cytosine-5)-methyltransferase 1
MTVVPVVDLFAGPGGLGEGFAAFTDNNVNDIFEIALSVEKHPTAHKTLELRSFFRKFPKNSVPDEYYEYLRGEIPRDHLFHLFPTEADEARREAWCETLGSGVELNRRLDSYIKRITKSVKDEWVLIGGPPCQAYSTVGRARRRNIKDYLPEKDKRNFLYLEYLRILAKHQPAVFVMENVKGMLSSRINGNLMFKQILQDLKCPPIAINENSPKNSRRKVEYDIYSFTVPCYGVKPNLGWYSSNDFIIESEEYGIPQARHRVILLGVKKGLLDNHAHVLKKEDPIHVKDVLDGLHPLRSGLSREKDELALWKSRLTGIPDRQWFRQGLKAKKIIEVQKAIFTAVERIRHINYDRGDEFVSGSVSVRRDLEWWYIDERLQGVCNHASRAHMTSDLHRYLFSACFAETLGRSPKILEFPTRLIPNHKNAKSGHFDDRFKVQMSELPSTTITSHISKDGHYFIHYDPAQCRSLTVREAARLQTFPDNYFFEGYRTAQYKQVGNAVPPLLAYKIADIIYKSLFS